MVGLVEAASLHEPLGAPRIFLVVVRYAVSQAHGAVNGNEIAVNHARHVAVRRSETS